MSNTLTAFAYIAKNLTAFGGITTRVSENRINAVGDHLEAFIQYAFASIPLDANEGERDALISKTFSYLGNQTNPPDMMLRQGDAVEVKKIQTVNGDLALNSSYPKQKIYANDPSISSACRACEDWTERDLIYVVGVAKDQQLKSLWMVYGDCYAASKEVYLNVQAKIKAGVLEIPNIEFAETTELGKLKKVDPLGITLLRMRGMWHITNPAKLFNRVWDGSAPPVQFPHGSGNEEDQVSISSGVRPLIS